MLKKTAVLLMFSAWVCGAYAADDDDDSVQRRLRFENREAVRGQEDQALSQGQPESAAARADGQEQWPLRLLAAVNRADAAQAERLLAEYRSLPDHDADFADFVEASIFRLRGNYPQSLRRYRALLEKQPEFVRARLDYARALFDDRQTKEAHDQFGRLQQEELPPAVQQNIDAYLNAAQVREGWHGSLALGAVYNSNVRETTGSLYCFDPFGLTCAQTPDPEKAYGLTYEASAEKYRALYGHHGLFARAALYGTRYRHHPDSSDDTLGISAGYRYASAKQSWSLAPAAEWNRADSHLLYRSIGVHGEWQYNLSPKTALSTEADHKIMRYGENYSHNNGSLSSLYASLLYAPADAWLLYGGASVQKRKTQNRPNSYHTHAFYAGGQYRFGNTASLRLQFSLRYRRYEAFNPWIQVRRYDREQSYSATLKIPRWQIAGFTPVLTAKHTRVRSNADWLAGYRKNEISFKLERFF